MVEDVFAFCELCDGRAVIVDMLRWMIGAFMEVGDILIFEATIPHLWRNPFDVQAKFLLVLQTPNASREPVQRHFSSHPSVNHIGG